MPLPVQVDVYEADNSTLVCSLTHNEAVPADARQVRELSGRVSLEFGNVVENGKWALATLDISIPGGGPS